MRFHWPDKAGGATAYCSRSGGHPWLPYRPASSRNDCSSCVCSLWSLFNERQDAAGYGRQGCPPLRIGGSARHAPQSREEMELRLPMIYGWNKLCHGYAA